MLRLAFEIHRVVPLDIQQWRVSGRALELVEVGTIVYHLFDRTYELVKEPNFEVKLVDPGEISLENSYTITAISSYGKAIDQLYSVMTGDIVVEGLSGELLQKVTHFVIDRP